MNEKEKLDLKESLPVTQFKAKAGFKTLSEYVCKEGERIPFALRGSIDGVEVTYLNVYPLVKQWSTQNQFGARAGTPIKNLLAYSGLSLPKGTYGDIISYLSKLFFKKAILEGNVQITSPSIVFSPLPSQTSIQVKNEGTTTDYTRVVSAKIEGADKETLSTSNATLIQGKGFYARLSSGQSVISADGANITLLLGLADGKSVNLNTGSHLEFKVVGSHEVYLRTPEVSVTGESQFNTTYAYRELKIYPLVLGQDLIVDGHVEFSVPLSDTYSMAQDFTWSGSKHREPPVYQRPEGQDFRNALPWIIILLVFTIFCYLIYQSGRTKEEKNYNSPDKKE